MLKRSTFYSIEKAMVGYLETDGMAAGQPAVTLCGHCSPAALAHAHQTCLAQRMKGRARLVWQVLWDSGLCTKTLGGARAVTAACWRLQVAPDEGTLPFTTCNIHEAVTNMQPWSILGHTPTRWTGDSRNMAEIQGAVWDPAAPYEETTLPSGPGTQCVPSASCRQYH